MTVYSILKTYQNNDIYYQVLPYNLKGTIYTHFKFYKGFKTLIPFLIKCRLTKKSCNKIVKKMSTRIS